MLVAIECITTGKAKPRPKSWLWWKTRNQILFGSGALDLAQTSSLTAQTAQVEQLRTANLVRANLLDLIDNLGVVGEDTLNALAEAHLANCKGTLGALVAGDYHSLKGLQTLFFAFTNLH